MRITTFKSEFRGRENPRELDFVSKWVLTFGAIFGLLIAAYTFVYYGAQHEASNAQLESALPADYRATVKVLVASAGLPCVRVCDVNFSSAGTSSATWRVSCGIGEAARPCAVTRDFTLSIAPVPEATR